MHYRLQRSETESIVTVVYMYVPGCAIGLGCSRVNWVYIVLTSRVRSSGTMSGCKHAFVHVYFVIVVVDRSSQSEEIETGSLADKILSRCVPWSAPPFM
jgi:hypothetical protein